VQVNGAPALGLEPTTYGSTVRCRTFTVVHRRPPCKDVASILSALVHHRQGTCPGSAVRLAVNTHPYGLSHCSPKTVINRSLERFAGWQTRRH
jgi:hypothetical protein